MGMRPIELTMSRHQPVWKFPPHRFVEYEQSDERWARPLGFGHEETILVEDTVTAVVTAMRMEPMIDAMDRIRTEITFKAIVDGGMPYIG